MIIFIFFSFSIVLFFYSINLKIKNKNESNLVNSVSLAFDVPTENDSIGRFWWFNNGQNNLKVTNYSNEKRKVEVFLDFQNNPCQNLLGIEFMGNLKNNLKINFETILKPYQTQKYTLNILTESPCRVIDDSRIFGARLRNWYLK